MNVKKITWQNFKVLRWNATSVRILEGKVRFDGVTYTVPEFLPEEQEPPQELGDGTHSAWLKMTFAVRKNLVNLQLVGIDPGDVGEVYARMYNHEYYSPQFEYAVGKSSDQAVEDQPILQRKFGSVIEVFYMKIADIVVSSRGLIIENERVSSTELPMLHIPVLKDFFGLGQRD